MPELRRHLRDCLLRGPGEFVGGDRRRAVWFVTYFALRRVVQEAADPPDERLDEREILLRDRSYFESYRLLGGAVAASLLLVIVDDAVGDLVVSWSGAWALLLFLSAVLPGAVLAYRQQVAAKGLARTQM